MTSRMNRRQFIQTTAAGCVACAWGPVLTSMGIAATPAGLISPGCRGTKVKVARVFLGVRKGWAWPKPDLDAMEEVQFYKAKFAELGDELRDVDFTVDALVSSAEHVGQFKDRLSKVDGIIAIHLTMGVGGALNALLGLGKPTVIFAVPYSGHEWVGFGGLLRQKLGARAECMLTSDYGQLTVAMRPFRAIHHLREAKILNVTTRSFADYAAKIKGKFGTQIKTITLDDVLDAYKAVDDGKARAEAKRWTEGAEQVVEPSAADIFKSCKLALAFERLLDRDKATVMTADCYGTMWARTIKFPAYPCLGFTRLNNMGLGGICESDLRSAMTHIIFQGLSGKPGFISDPTVDESNNTIILAHCLGTMKMDGPDGPAAPYKLRTVMERQEGVVPQVEMRIGEKVTQAILVGTDLLPYFTGRIVDAPVSLADDRGCRTKITVEVDGQVTRLWKNWGHGLHRQTCYGDITKELAMFCRFKDIRMVDEAVKSTAEA